MPTRTPEEKKLIDSLPIKKPDKLCNARTPTGYCRLKAGYMTDHLGEGRCKFHGGRAGRSPTHGMYSAKMVSTIKKEFDKLVSNPLLVDLYGELAVAKALLSNLLGNLKNKLSDEQSNWWVQVTEKGDKISAEASAVIKLLEQLSRLYTRIVDAEKKSQESLSVRDVYLITQQIKVTMNDTCGECPVRKNVSGKLQNARMANVVEESSEQNKQ